MNFTPVTSSLLIGVHYDPNTRELTVEFKGRKKYRYHGVAQATYDAMMESESVGKYFLNNIKHNFECSKVGK